MARAAPRPAWCAARQLERASGVLASSPCRLEQLRARCADDGLQYRSKRELYFNALA
jgi:hypothetical protein